MQSPAKATRGDQARRELLDIAIDCFARFGYQATSIDRIAKAAGVTKGALYYHFRDKEELLFEAVGTRVGQFERKVASGAAECRDAEQTLRRVTGACVEHATMSNHRRFIVTLMVETLDTNARISKQFREMMDRFRQFLGGIVRAGQSTGLFRSDVDGAVAARIYAGAVMGAELQYYQDPEAADLAQTLETFLTQFLSWLAVPTRAGRSGRAAKKGDPMISFQPSEDQQMIRDTVASFAAEQVRPAAHEADETGNIPAAIVQQGWDLGLAQSAIPEAFGGAGDERSAISGSLVAEELAWGDLSIGLNILAPRLFINPIVDAGTEAQKKDLLPAFTGASFRAGTAALLEPRFGFDTAELQTTARYADGHYVINGAKCMVPIANDAENLLVYASEGGAGIHKVGAFIVPKTAPGLTIAEREKNMGLKALETFELTLENCKVPAGNRLGGDKGCDYGRLLNFSRVGLSAMAVGIARAAFEYARDYAKERRAFGVAIAQKQAIAFMLAEMATEIDATRLLTWEAAWRLDKGLEATREAVIAKQYAANTVLKVTDNALQILGGHGYIREHPVELWLRDGRGFATFEGLVML